MCIDLFCPRAGDEGPRVRRPDRVLRDHLPEGAHDGAEGRDSRDPRAVGQQTDHEGLFGLIRVVAGFLLHRSC